MNNQNRLKVIEKKEYFIIIKHSKILVQTGNKIYSIDEQIEFSKFKKLYLKYKLLNKLSYDIKNDTLYKYYCKIEDDYEKKWAKKEFYTFISNQNNIFILSHPKPVGYLKARVIRDEVEIISILIDKKYRKAGIGKSLLDRLLNIALKNLLDSSKS